ncbi:iron complex transport system permease protein [Methanofollis sp. W23]|uniref:FecCD family ABC transporter permease n=1 Tax=Methanofollis sp. W23 TaxID=2817849 RepID=UPI001AE59D69|nr:iron ABC transporter permease [Methanofollis sp. W23]MBP2145419.1 iron complex transport system permease protein [Methanofollis sp. W23]
MNTSSPKKDKNILYFGGVIVSLLVLILIALCAGAFPVTPGNILSVLCSALFGEASENVFHSVVILDVRIPRILLAVSIGAGLSVAGCVYQAVFRNPLVEPYLLGASSGAAFGAGLAIVLGFQIFSLQVTALLFSLSAVFLVYSLATKDGKTQLLHLILIGIVINALFTAGLSFLKTIAHSEQLRDLTFWLMGGIYVADWKDVLIIVPAILIAFLILWSMAWRMNVITLGDDEAQTLGLDVQKTRIITIFFSTLIASLAVATVGIIAWVGLIIPHIARMLVGPEHRALVPFSALFGGAFLLLCDTLARTLTGGEVPISILTSVIAAPYIIYLVRRNKAIFVG